MNPTAESASGPAQGTDSKRQQREAPGGCRPAGPGLELILGKQSGTDKESRAESKTAS